MTTPPQALTGDWRRAGDRQNWRSLGVSTMCRQAPGAGLMPVVLLLFCVAAVHCRTSVPSASSPTCRAGAYYLASSVHAASRGLALFAPIHMTRIPISVSPALWQSAALPLTKIGCKCG